MIYMRNITITTAKSATYLENVGFNNDPPFAISYDGNSGAGSSWEPRVADPRGRSFTVQVEVKF
jgi:hypothetical protein